MEVVAAMEGVQGRWSFYFKGLWIVQAVFFLQRFSLKTLALHFTGAIIKKDFGRSMKSPLNERALQAFWSIPDQFHRFAQTLTK